MHVKKRMVKMKDIKKLYMENKFAIDELKKDIGSIDEKRIQIQEILRGNLKKYPNIITWNNLGVYYSEYGMIRKNGKERSASKLGLRYLIKAAENSSDWRCYMNVAKAIWEREKWGMSGEIEQGYAYIKKAYTLCDNICVKYDYGAYLIELKKYKEAKKVFLQICNENNNQCISQRNGMDPYVVLAYLCAELNEMSEGKRYLEFLETKKTTIDLYDSFVLKYNFGSYEKAVKEELELLRVWFPSDELIAMIVDMHLALGRTYSKKLIELLDDRSNMLEVYKFNEELRKKIIRRNTLGISLITGYIFIEV